MLELLRTGPSSDQLTAAKTLLFCQSENRLPGVRSRPSSRAVPAEGHCPRSLLLRERKPIHSRRLRNPPATKPLPETQAGSLSLPTHSLKRPRTHQRVVNRCACLFSYTLLQR